MPGTFHRRVLVVDTLWLNMLAVRTELAFLDRIAVFVAAGRAR